MPKVRKWYSSLEKWEEDRYWACFRFLYLMKPDEKYEKDDDSENIKKGDQKFNYYIPDSKGKYTLKHQCTSKHDELTAIHATCCEHYTNFFGHFHRNYLIYVEMYLDKADKILRASNKYFDVLVSQEELQLMRKEYKGILSQAKGEIGPITIPCWDILRTREEIKLPEILRQPKTDIFEKCLERVTGANLGFFDPRKMWYTGCYHDQADNFLKTGISQTQKKSYQKLQPINLNEKCDDDINRFYGNGKYNFFKKPRVQGTQPISVIYSYTRSLMNDDLLSGAIQENQYTPFKGSDGFLTRKELSFEHSHNYMHDSLGFPMKDNSFSVLNPVFYLYHATIDYMLELKLRLVQQDIDKNGPQDNIKELNAYFGARITNIDQLWSLKKKIYQHLKESNGQLRYGDLPVFDWFNQKKQEKMTDDDFSHGHIYYKNLIMKDNNDKIGPRLSYQLDELYDKSRYFKIAGYAYEWNYDYEDFVNKEGKPIQFTMKKELSQVIEQVKKRYRKQGNVIESFGLNLFLQDDDEKRQRKPTTSTDEIIKDLALQKIGPIEGVRLLNQYRQNVREISWFYAKTQYLTTIGSQIVDLSIIFKDPNNFPWRNTPQYQRHSDEFCFHSIPLLTKGKGSEICPNCPQYEIQKRNIGRLFLAKSYPLYLDLLRATKRGVLYHNLSNGLTSDYSVTDFVKISSSIPELKVEILEGAFDVSFTFIFCQELPQAFKNKVVIYDPKRLEYQPLDQKISYQIIMQGQTKNFHSGQSHSVKRIINRNENNNQVMFDKMDTICLPDTKKFGDAVKKICEQKDIDDYYYQSFKGTVTDKNSKKQINFDFKLKRFHNLTPKYYFYVSSKGEIVVVNQNLFIQQAILKSAEAIFNQN